jgi:hypothetical protein
VRKRSELLAHIQNTKSQYNLPQFEKKIALKANREGVAERFPDPSVRKSIEVDLKLLDGDTLFRKKVFGQVNAEWHSDSTADGRQLDGFFLCGSGGGLRHQPGNRKKAIDAGF